MRFLGFKFRGLGPFQKEQSIDLTSVPGPLIAVTGENGAGKSTLLELLGGALYRETATRGKLSRLATERNAYIEVRAVNGKHITVRQEVDAVSGNGEAIVIDEAGNVLTKSSKVTEFDEWASEHITPKAVFYASTFSAQGSVGIVGMGASDRKRLLLQTLGIDRFEVRAERARTALRAAEAAAVLAAERLSDEQARGCSVADAEAELATSESAAKRARLDHEEADARVVALRASVEGSQEALVRFEAAKRRLEDIQQRLVDARTTHASLTLRRRELQKQTDRLDSLEAQLAKAVETDSQLATLRSQNQESLAALDAAKAELRTAQVELRAERQAVVRADEAVSEARRVEETRAKLTEVVEGAHDLASDIEKAAVRVKALESERANLETSARTSKNVRITALRTSVGNVAAEADARRRSMAADEALYQDDVLEHEATSTPDEIRVIDEELVTIRRQERALDRLRGEVGRAKESLAALHPNMTGEVDAQHGLAVQAVTAREKGIAAAKSSIDTLERDADLAMSALGACSDVGDPETIRGLLRTASSAAVRLEEVTAQIDVATLEIEALASDVERAALPERPTLPDVEQAERTLAELDQRRGRASLAFGGAQQQLEMVRASVARVGELSVALGGTQRHAADWKLAAHALSKDGVQALEVDAAGPEITAIANDLLNSCYGPRWTVSLETTRRSSDNKKDIETFDIRVLDTESGVEDSIQWFSGGERVILGEALSLALSVVACRVAGIERPTLIRDESGAALDPERAVAYVAMLRRAAVLIDADRVLFVSHSPEVVALADSRLHVADGRVDVQMGPWSPSATSQMERLPYYEPEPGLLEAAS